MASDVVSVSRVSENSTYEWHYVPSSGKLSTQDEEQKSTGNKTGTEVSLSDEALAKLGFKYFEKKIATANLEENQKTQQPGQLSDQQKAEVEKLKAIDQKVRAHEQAHQNAGGVLVRRGATYDYQIGPDGVRYAVGGDVQLDVSPGKNAQETEQKAEQIIAAALAPADPSPQDLRVAAQAASMENQARMDTTKEKSKENTSGTAGVAGVKSKTSETDGATAGSGAVTQSDGKVSGKSGVATTGSGTVSQGDSTNNNKLSENTIDTKKSKARDALINKIISTAIKSPYGFAGQSYQQALNPTEATKPISVLA